MRIFLSVLILIFSFQSSTKADDISKFEIEGMSVGDSLLYHFNKKKILERKQKNQFPKSDKYIISTFYEDSFNIYESVSISYENNKKFIIGNIEGRIFFKNNIQECLKKRIEISDAIEASLENVKKKDFKKNHGFDPTGNSKYISTSFEFQSLGNIQVSCTDWSTEIENKGFSDELKVSIASSKFRIFLDEEAFE